jgi:hypothetical protein
MIMTSLMWLELPSAMPVSELVSAQWKEVALIASNISSNSDFRES